MHFVSRHIDSLSLHLDSLSWWMLILLAALGIAMAVWYYRNPSPPVPAGKRRLLFALRAAAFILLFFALTEPVLKTVFTVSHPHLTAVLIDASSSIARPDDPDRLRDARSCLAALHSRLGNRGVYLAFDSRVRALDGGDPAFDGDATDMAAALEAAAAREDVRAIVLVGDGRWNLGKDPATFAPPEPVAVHTVCVGTTATAPDVILRGVSAPPVGRTGKTVALEVTVAASGKASGTVPVDIFEKGQRVAGGKTSFDGPGVSTVAIEVPVAGVGTHTFTASIAPSFSEAKENNSRSFIILGLKSSFDVLIVAPGPSPDFAFVRRSVESDSAFTVRAVLGKGGVMAERAFPARLDSIDAMIVLDGGGSALDDEHARLVAAWLTGGKGLFALGSVPPAAGAPLEKLLPFTFDRTAGVLPSAVAPSLTPDGMSHYITSAAVDRTIWGALPPAGTCAVVKPTEGARVLATIPGPRQGTAVPVIVTGVHGKGRTVASPVSGVWRWRLMMEGAGRGGGFFDAFIRGTIRWLSSETEMRPLTVTTDSGSYLGGQEVRFEARIFDSVFAPVRGGEVTVAVDGDPALKTVLDETAPGVYTGMLRGAPAGKHEWTASALVGGARYAETKGTFTVEKFSLELLDPSPDPEGMAALAAKTGGVSVSPAGIDSVLSRLPSGESTERGESDRRLALSPIAPFLIIALLGIEWLLRKRSGMI